MQCKKCSYSEPNMTKIFGSPLCKVCSTFAPVLPKEFQDYISEKIDWKILDVFRNLGKTRGDKQKEGMEKMAKLGRLNSRPPLGYDARNGNLIPNEDAIKVRSLYKTFLARTYSLNSLSKNFALSVNGLKKVLTNRTYLGEIKFDGKIYKGDHPSIISPEIFYATQRKLKTYLNPRKK
ncbi:hypothetical protein HNV12_04195 [Methanococcoides sp. SA1]|nr:hypothetical protein [Methanococcoides sp. SA1]